MLRSASLRLLLLIGLVLGVAMPVAAAQSAQVRKDSLARVKEMMVEFKARIAFADSSKDAKESVNQRLLLVPLCKRPLALKLYQEAAFIADTAQLKGDEELRAREGLVELYRASGNWRKAFEEEARVLELSKERMSEQAKHELDLQRMDEQAASTQLVNAENVRSMERVKYEAELKGMRNSEERWKLFAWVGGATCLLMFALLLFLMRRERTNMRAQIASLRAEVAALRVPVKNRMREPVVPSVVVPQPIIAVPQVPEVIEVHTSAMDGTLLALFRKRAPERLATLRDARARGDHEKAARVVHTLKPQLVALDENGLGALCLRITANDAQQDQQRWNADLDLLERSVDQLLA